MDADRSDDTQPSVGDRSPWWKRLRKAPSPHVEVLLFKTEECPLCDDAEELLLAQVDRLGLQLEITDGEARPDLLERHRLEAPVVFVAGRKRFMGRVPLPLLRREVDAARRAAGG